MAHESDKNVNNDLGKYRPFGGWLEKPEDIQHPLVDEITADVVIIGGGFAGLSTALEVAEKGAKVVVLERDFAGFGASGRNAGYLAGSMGIEFELFLKRVGPKKAREIIRFYDEGVSYVEGRLEKLGIYCDYNASGLIRAAIHPSQEKRLRKSMEIGLELGSQTKFLDQAAMRARGIPTSFLFGCYQEHGGTLDPGKYVLGLRRAALQAGVKIYEQTPLVSYTEGAVVSCETPLGRVHAPHMVLATNAYTPQLGLLGNKVAAIRVSAIETEQLTAAQLDSLGWEGREGIVTPHLTMESHRLTARNTLVITTKRLNYMFGSKTPNVPDRRAYRELAVALNDRFPTLQGLGIKSCWSGYVSLAYDALPVVGEIGANQNILYTAGCAGHGVATQSLMGRLLGDRIGGAEHPLLSALRHRTPTTLPEPLQWCALKCGLAGANSIDSHINRKARRR